MTAVQWVLLLGVGVPTLAVFWAVTWWIVVRTLRDAGPLPRLQLRARSGDTYSYVCRRDDVAH